MSKRSPAGNKAVRGHAVSGFFVFCLIALFAVLATTLTLVGISAYRNVYRASVSNSEGQIAVSYLRNKVRAFDRDGGVLVQTLDDHDVLCLREELDGELYETRVYCDGSSLMEYFCPAEDEFDSEFGEAVASLQALSLRLEKPWLLTLNLRQADGASLSAHIALHTEEAST